MITLNNRIKLLRKTLGLTEENFAQKIGITKSSVSLLESGQNKASSQTIFILCKEFNVNEEWLRNCTGEMFNDEDKELEYYLGQISADSDEFKRSLIKNICKLSPEEWETLKRVVTETYIDSKKDR